MSTNSNASQSDLLDPSLRVEQRIEGDRDQAIGQVLGGIVVYVNGGQAVFHSASAESDSSVPKATHSEIGPNPYKGLMAFQETDGERKLFFGRDKEIATLWEKLCVLHEETSKISILPIFGPSGSGKSSLARAGLIYELSQRPLPGRDCARVAILVPGSHPLEALATVLARVATNDPTPVAKTREFRDELENVNDSGACDGLRRIVNILPETDISPLILLVDQFEEIYSLCKDATERDRFIASLLEAGAEESQRVLIVITLRSDFLDDIQKHPGLNRLFSRQGFLVPAMDAEELQEIIVKPAELAGYTFDEATICLLVADTEGRDGALPLLQCALSCIWQGLQKGVTPTQTLRQMGGVGGALAGEAQAVYDSLDTAEQAMARRLFLGLVQLGEGIRDTRRRITLDCLISHKDDPEQFKQVMYRFAESGVRLITCSISPEGVETAEITHEALLGHWALLKQWLEQSRTELRFQRRLEEDAQDWNRSGRPEGSLWRPPDLDLLRQYQEQSNAGTTQLQMEFFTAAQKAEDRRKQEEIWKHKQERQHQIQKVALCSLIVGVIGFAGYQQQQAEVRQVKQLADFPEILLSNQPLNAEINDIAQVNAIAAVGLSQSGWVGLTQNEISNSAYRALLHTIQVVQGRKLLSDKVLSVAFSQDGQQIVSGGMDDMVRLWNANTQQPIGQPLKGHQKAVIAVAFSPDGQRIVSGSVDKTIRLWNAKTGEPIGKPLKGHAYSVVAVAFSPDGKTIVSGSDDKTIRLWDADTGKLIRQLQGNDFQPTLVGFTENKTIFARSYNSTVRLWKTDTGELINEQKEDNSQTPLVAFSTSGRTIVSRSYDSLGDDRDRLLKEACTQLSEHLSFLNPKTHVDREAKQICDRYVWNHERSAPQP